jgi:N-acetylmuramoyl-L-alanine amidase
VLVAAHRKENRTLGWATFPEKQLQAAFAVARALIEHYQLVDVLGHDEVHEHKVDPGPAFPLEAWREALFGRPGARIETFETARPALLYRNEAGNPQAVIGRHPASSLPSGTAVRRRETKNGWTLVCTLEKLHRHGYASGWVRAGELRLWQGR